MFLQGAFAAIISDNRFRIRFIARRERYLLANLLAMISYLRHSVIIIVALKLLKAGDLSGVFVSDRSSRLAPRP